MADGEAPIEGDFRAQLNQALAAAIRAVKPEPAASIDADLMPAPLRFGSGCAATITLNSPAVVGDLAFVESSYVCGGLCGSGTLLALQYRDEHWSVVAYLPTWIS